MDLRIKNDYFILGPYDHADYHEYDDNDIHDDHDVETRLIASLQAKWCNDGVEGASSNTTLVDKEKEVELL